MEPSVEKRRRKGTIGELVYTKIQADGPSTKESDLPSVEEVLSPFFQKDFVLHSYQEEGIRFMCDILLDREKEFDRFIFLGDEMGLGKTVQILATALYIHTIQKFYRTSLLRGVVLIVVPRVIIPNFVKNGNEFFGIPKCHFIHYTGSRRVDTLKRSVSLINSESKYPVFIMCNPEIVRADGETSVLFDLPLTLLVLDEAHRIKNHNTKTNKIMRSFRDPVGLKGTRGFIFSTATFVCNSLNDLLGYVAVYGGTEKMIMVKRWIQESTMEDIQRYFGSHMVRRTVSILQDALPDRKEILIPVIPSSIEASIIDMLSDNATCVWKAHQSIKDAGATNEEISRMAAMVLVNIMRLRQGCICPAIVSGYENREGKSSKTQYQCCVRCFLFSDRLELMKCGHRICATCIKSNLTYLRSFSDESLVEGYCPLCSLICLYYTSHPVGTSTKFFYASRVLKTMLDSDDGAILVFSEFKRALDLFSTVCKSAHIPTLMLHGELTARQKTDVIDSFMKTDCPIRVLLLTIGTGGVGLNLQRASKVIILDPTWDPKKEEQAIGRVYRIGQTKDVKVVRLAYMDAVEDAMRFLQAKKHAAAKLVNEGVAYGGVTTDDTVELDFHDSVAMTRGGAIDKFMTGLREVVAMNYEKRSVGDRDEELLIKRANLAERLGVDEGWLIPDWKKIDKSERK